MERDLPACELGLSERVIVYLWEAILACMAYVDLKPTLECFELDTENWVKNVERYGSLFYRVAGPLAQIAARAREKGRCWLRGRSGSGQLYRNQPVAAQVRITRMMARASLWPDRLNPGKICDLRGGSFAIEGKLSGFGGIVERLAGKGRQLCGY